MDSNAIKEEYNLANRSKDLSIQMNFVRNLIECKSDECVNLHYSLLKNKEDNRFYFMIRSSFQKRGFDVGPFLKNKILTEADQDFIF